MPRVIRSSADEMLRALTEGSAPEARRDGFSSPAKAWLDCLALSGAIGETIQASSALSEVYEAIARMRSVRSFSGVRPLRVQLDYIISSARAATPVMSAHEVAIDVVVDLDGDGRAEIFKVGESGLSESKLPIQFPLSDLYESYVSAPALLLFSGPVASNASAYRSMLLAASCTGYTAWLAAIMIGLDGCVFGRSHGDISDAVAAHRGYGYRHLFTLALGKQG